jgi:hypothetical protein
MNSRAGSTVDPVSGILHPIGPEPPMVYWIRRAAIVVLVIVLILALWWLAGSLRGGDSTSAQPSDTVAASATPEASTDTGGDGGGDGGDSTTSAEPSAAATDAEPAACADSDIKVEATTDSSTYPVGSTPRLTLTITNTGTVACKRDVGPKANELLITSGGYHVWSSDDCNASNKSKMATLKPKEPVASSITWDGHLSEPGCANGEGAAAKAGTYRVTGRNGKVESDPTPFSLTNAE